MKAIVFDRRPGAPVALPPLFRLVPDSALTVSGQPVFLPDLPGVWEAQAGIALRVSRLGKGISPKFARRYVDALTVAVLTIPVTVEATLAGSGAHTSATWCFDGALTPGKWLPLEPEAKEVTFSLGPITKTVTVDDLRIDDCIAAASSLMTLKTGDIIIPALCRPGLSVKTGDTLRSTADGTDVLTYKVR